MYGRRRSFIENAEIAKSSQGLALQRALNKLKVAKRHGSQEHDADNFRETKMSKTLLLPQETSRESDDLNQASMSRSLIIAKKDPFFD